MNAEFFRKLDEYSKAAIKLAKKYFKMEELEFDHICYQTVSKKDYKRALKQLEGEADIIGEISHTGRSLTLARLLKPITIDGVAVTTLEVAEPKPKRVVQSRSFDHFSFTVKGSFESAIDTLRSKGAKISEIKQIADHKFVKCIGLKTGVEIEFRNKKLAEAVKGQDVKRRKRRGGSSIIEQVKKSVQKKKKGADLERKLKQEREKGLRALADYQNLAKRFEEERKKITTLANAVILGELLDILDDFDRVIDNLKVEEKEQVGVRMIRDKLRQVIDANGLEEIKCTIGDKLDPNMCEAVGVVAVEKEKENNTVKQIVQKGYKMKEGDQVVRPVKVIVGKQ